MRFDAQSSVSLIILTLVNVCVCLQDFAEKTLHSALGSELTPGSVGHHQHHRHHHQHPNKPNDGHAIGMPNFLLVDQLADGEMERRVHYDGLTGKATSLTQNSTQSLHLWQLTDGKAFIQMIYARDDELLDCELVRQPAAVRSFLGKFRAEFAVAQARNFTSQPTVRNADQDDDRYANAMQDFRALTMDQYGYSTLDDRPTDDNELPSDDAFGMRPLRYTELRSADELPAELRPLMRFAQLRRQCDERHRQMKRLVQDLSSEHPERRSAAGEHLQRKKRDLFLAPNTMWCGSGQSATAYNQLGGSSRTDKCCRRHDNCKLNIHALTSKWHLFNYRLFTISHCNCDMRFRTCLKMAGNQDATMVGKLFFNIVQTKCFVLKPESVCVKRSWWKCEKRIIRKRAHIRDNRKF